LKKIAKHSTDFNDDDSESAKNKNEDIEEKVDKKEKSKLFVLNILCK